MAITLASEVTDYLTSVRNSLTTGPDLGSSIRGAAQNYLRAQDLSTVLELLQAALAPAGNLTATGGSATTVEDTGAFIADTQVGNVVTFTGNVTGGLTGVTATVVANDANSLTFAGGALPATPAIGDTFSVTPAFLDEKIDSLRQGVGLADAPPGSVYGDSRTAEAALIRGIEQLGGTVPSTTSDMIQVHPGGQPGDNDRLASLIQALQDAVEASTVPPVA